MAQSNVIVRLSLKDADAVQRGLVALGADGEKALKRIEAAGRTPSAGLKALGAASDELKGKFGQLSGNAGVVGSALEALGPRGLLAAAGIGALVAALGFAIGRAGDAMATFDTLGDSAARIGVSLKTLQELQYGFGQSGVSAEQLETALTKLNDTLGDVLEKGAETPKEVASAFAELGISLQDVLKSAGDLGVLLPQIAEGTKNLGTQAERTAVLKTLMGKSAAVLIPLFLEGADGLERMAKAAHDAGAVFDEEMAKALGDQLAPRPAEARRTAVAAAAAERRRRWHLADRGAGGHQHHRHRQHRSDRRRAGAGVGRVLRRHGRRFCRRCDYRRRYSAGQHLPAGAGAGDLQEPGQRRPVLCHHRSAQSVAELEQGAVSAWPLQADPALCSDAVPRDRRRGDLLADAVRLLARADRDRKHVHR